MEGRQPVETLMRKTLDDDKLTDVHRGWSVTRKGVLGGLRRRQAERAHTDFTEFVSFEGLVLRINFWLILIFKF